MKFNMVTVIGGSGFVGTNLCELLHSKDIEFEILDIKKSPRFPEKTKIADVRDLGSMIKAITGDLVINLAAVHRDDSQDSEYHDTNVLGAENVVLALDKLGISNLIFTSSVAVYGFAPPQTSEKGEINPFNEYGRTKFAAEKVYERWQEASGGSLCIIRPTVIFGEGNRGNVYNLFAQIASGKFLMIGDGQNVKSMAYVGNLVAFIFANLNRTQKYSLYNYVDAPSLDMNALVTLTRRRLLGKDGVGFRLPLWFGLGVGWFVDLLSLILSRNFAISSIRVRKFCSSSDFTSCYSLPESFSLPYSLTQGIERTLEAEFIAPDPNRLKFYTE